jgi:hypothetical protein
MRVLASTVSLGLNPPPPVRTSDRNFVYSRFYVPMFYYILDMYVFRNGGSSFRKGGGSDFVVNVTLRQTDSWPVSFDVKPHLGPKTGFLELCRRYVFYWSFVM